MAEIVGSVDLANVEAEMAFAPGASVSEAVHPVIPPEFAPPKWQPAIRRLLDRYPFDQNVFCMTRFPRDSAEEAMPDPIRAVIETVRSALADFGLRLHLASDRSADDELFGNIAAHMWACRYGIGLFETRFDAHLNDNVQIEIGGMLISGRRCALLKDHGTPNLPSDFVSYIYKAVDFDDLDAIADTVAAWARDDLTLAPVV